LLIVDLLLVRALYPVSSYQLVAIPFLQMDFSLANDFHRRKNCLKNREIDEKI